MKNEQLTYRKIPLIHPGRIDGQRTNSMGLYSGGWGGAGRIGAGAYIREEKHFNFQSVKLITFLSFFSEFVITSRHKW